MPETKPPFMIQSGIIPIEKYLDLERIMRCNHHLMKNDPLVVVELPQENPLFNNPPKPQAKIHGELLMAQRTLHEYALLN
ncbi:hypothetical protein J1N35_025274 [Gossypium stocksii]|uniref:Uncharacterized protein n=1 Tax=Gossypium stocksii TaxID=47602 RepID=A0A9D3ZXI1_9ROSI|nr:hypothetical protein J1N35_025274 [Gossypium stocksii]